MQLPGNMAMESPMDSPLNKIQEDEKEIEKKRRTPSTVTTFW